MSHEELRELTMETFHKIYDKGYEEGREAGYAARIEDEEKMMRKGHLRVCGIEDNEGEYTMRHIDCPLCQRRLAVRIKADERIEGVAIDRKKEDLDV